MHRNQKGIILPGLILLLVVIGVIGFAGLRIYVVDKSTSEKNVLGYQIPSTDCDKILPKVKDHLFSGESGDNCYSKFIKVGEEKIEYIIIEQSQEYQKSYREKVDRACNRNPGEACMPTIFVGNQVFIVRSDGSIEPAHLPLPDWPGWAGILIAIDDLTGCPAGDFSTKYDYQGDFVIEDGRVGMRFKVKNINYSGFGSSCRVDIDVIGFTDAEQPKRKFKELTVKYKITEPQECEKVSRPDKYQCYENQARMRGDLNLCNSTFLNTSTATAPIECINAVATRKLDTTLCGGAVAGSNVYVKDNDRKRCERLVEENRGYLDEGVSVRVL